MKVNFYLIKYSKNFQKKIGVDIDNYKKASGKLRIIGKFGKGQEYIMDLVIHYLKVM